MTSRYTVWGIFTGWSININYKPEEFNTYMLWWWFDVINLSWRKIICLRISIWLYMYFIALKLWLIYNIVKYEWRNQTHQTFLHLAFICMQGTATDLAMHSSSFAVTLPCGRSVKLVALPCQDICCTWRKYFIKYNTDQNKSSRHCIYWVYNYPVILVLSTISSVCC